MAQSCLCSQGWITTHHQSQPKHWKWVDCSPNLCTEIWQRSLAQRQSKGGIWLQHRWLPNTQSSPCAVLEPGIAVYKTKSTICMSGWSEWSCQHAGVCPLLMGIPTTLPVGCADSRENSNAASGQAAFPSPTMGGKSILTTSVMGCTSSQAQTASQSCPPPDALETTPDVEKSKIFQMQVPFP